VYNVRENNVLNIQVAIFSSTLSCRTAAITLYALYMKETQGKGAGGATESIE
jgi:hypothetical protein